MKSVGVVGYRSWIGQVLMDRIQERTPHRIVMFDKGDAASWDTTDYLALFIIPGKLVQTEQERSAERQLVHDIAASKHTCKRQFLLSSQSIYTDLDSEYGRHKYLVEQSFLTAAAGRRAWEGQGDFLSYPVRPGAVFGPTQDVNSPMLIPSIAREGGGLDLKTPDRMTKFISVYDLADYLVGLIENIPPRQWDTRDIPGTFEATPRQLLALWKTFAGLSAAGPGTGA